MTSDIRIDGERLWQTIMRSAEIGPGKAGGLSRLVATDEDKEVRDQFAEWCEEAGLTMSVDRLGNMFARRAGSQDDLPSVTIGSHLDTQYAGGRFDGILGVLAGLEVVRTLNDHDIQTKHPIEVINWTNEEGARFSPSMGPSGAFAGVFEEEFIASSEDDNGCKQGEELERIGYSGSEPVGGRTFDSYFELHIEQGPQLDAERIPLGIVTGGYKSYGMHVDVRGRTAHAGPTPMNERKDALVGASRVVVAVNDIGWKYHNTQGKTTCTRIVAWPNRPGIISDWAQFSVDCRHPDRDIAERMMAEIEQAIEEAADKAQVEMEIVTRWEFDGASFDPDLIDLMRSTAKEVGVPYKEMVSQAGHDAYYIARICPATLIFSPCKDGITHNEEEDAELKLTEPAVNVLLQAVIARANR